MADVQAVRGRRAGRAARLAACGAACMLCESAAQAIINPSFTPADMVRAAGSIHLLRVSVPREQAAKAEVKEAIKGQALAEKEIVFSLKDSQDLSEEGVAGAFGGRPSADAVLLLAQPEQIGGEDPSGSLLIGTLWFAVYGKPGAWRLDKDAKDTFSVWAGSAGMLARAARYVQADPAADFPVRALMTWTGEAQPGKLGGAAADCFVADFGEPVGECAVIASEKGDRAYRLGVKDTAPADVTATVKLTTASKGLAAGDLNGDGLLDLVSWDGKGLKAAIRTAAGTFEAKPMAAALADCLSLAVIDVGAAGGRGVLAGTSKGLVVIRPDAQGKYDVAPVDGAAAQGLGAGGAFALGDFTGDGKCDVAQFFSDGMALYAGEGAGRFQQPAVVKLQMPKGPRGAACGDFDGDGLLDAVVGGEDGMAVVSRNDAKQWENTTIITGELAYHGNANRPSITGVAVADLNGDGRQGVGLFSDKRKPMLFFNRGFACFGWARELDLAGEGMAAAVPGAMPPASGETKVTLKGTRALQEGTSCGAVADVNGDGFVDLMGVDPKGEAWVLFGRSDGRPLGVVLTLAASAAQPLTVSVLDKQRTVCMAVLRPGQPVFVGKANPGVYSLKWVGADGAQGGRQVMVTGVTRISLKP